MESRRITRSRSERMIAGVAGGLASYFQIDPLFIRLGLIVLSLINGVGVVIYLALWLIIPNEGSLAEGRSTAGEAIDEMRIYLEHLISQVRAIFTR